MCWAKREHRSHEARTRGKVVLTTLRRSHKKSCTRNAPSYFAKHRLGYTLHRKALTQPSCAWFERPKRESAPFKAQS